MYDLIHAGGVEYPETDKYHYNTWYPTNGLTDGNEYKAIRFNIRQDNLLLHWTNAYLVLEGQLIKKAGGTAFEDGDLITLIHNAIPHMFSNVKLSVGNRVVENINQIGHVSSMIYDVLYNRSKKNCDGLDFMWYPDTAATASEADNKGFAARRKYLITLPTTNGTFNLRIPLHMFFGFMENFVVLKGYPVEIEMVRGPDYPAIFRADAAGQGKLNFKSITLNVPVVEPFLYTFRERHGMFAPVPQGITDFQQPITSNYFTERPQMIWVGFQQKNATDQKFNPAT